LDQVPVTVLVGSAGFAIGIAYGAVTRWADFCALGAIADVTVNGDYRRLRTWLLAIATATIGVHGLHWLGVVDIYRSIYLGANFGWFGAIAGGLMFGYGTVMAGGCGSRSLIRLAGGDLRALVTLLFLGIFAYMTLRGFTGAGRVWMEGIVNVDLAASNLSSQGIPDLIGAASGQGAGAIRVIFSAGVVALLLWYCLKDGAFRRSRPHVIVGIAIGVLVSAGWAVTGVLGADEFEPVSLSSLTFVRPIGDSLQYLMTFTGASLDFGIAVIAGTLVGGFLAAFLGGSFRMTGFTGADEMIGHITGGMLMGIGGILALGCTIGQGITGVSTLSLGSLLALAAIVTGGMVGITRMGLDTADYALR
jgi:hypothetical protein